MLNPLNKMVSQHIFLCCEMDYYITANDFLSGPYEINNSGTYHLTVDVVFTSLNNSYKYAIGINAPNVILDLGGYTLSQDLTYAYYSRGFSLIYISPLASNCHSNCDTNNGGCGSVCNTSCGKKSSNGKSTIRISYGTLGRCSESSILADPNFTGKLCLSDLTTSLYETSSITVYTSLRCKNVNVGANFTGWILNYNYNAARDLLTVAGQIIANPSAWSYISMLANAMTNLKTDLDYVASAAQNLGYIPSEYSIYSAHNTSDSTIYYSKLRGGILFHPDNATRNSDQSRLSITESSVSNLTVNPQNISQIVRNLDSYVVLDPAGYKLQSLFYSSWTGTVIPHWGALLQVTSVVISDLSLNYPYIPADLRLGLTESGTSVPSSYTVNVNITVPSDVSFILVNAGKAKITRTTLSNLTVSFSGPGAVSFNGYGIAAYCKKICISRCTIDGTIVGIIASAKVIIIDNNTISNVTTAIHIVSYKELCMDCNVSSDPLIVDYIGKTLSVTANEN